jgi:hypothetical protein
VGSCEKSRDLAQKHHNLGQGVPLLPMRGEVTKQANQLIEKLKNLSNLHIVSSWCHASVSVSYKTNRDSATV